VVRSTWQEALSDLITDPKELITLLQLDPALLAAANKAASLFPLKVTRDFVARMEKGNPNDPLLQQILPLGKELILTPGYSDDPLQEANTNPVPGLLHKYENRVLATLTNACGVNCRFCFRRLFPYEDNTPSRRGWEKIVAYIAEHPKINEVILSGGDPLSVSDKLLKHFSDALTTIPHVKRLRIHTRLPIVLPSRISDEFIAWIEQLKFDVVIIVHMNHPNEINQDVRTAMQRLRRLGVTLLNQSVLLKGINDRADTLIALSETLFSAGVIPYYLHVLDKTQHTAHFDLDLETAKRLHQAITKSLPGYLVPRLVREDAGMPSKTLL
jgi:EF-P beta-lysylation protein EpmB